MNPLLALLLCASLRAPLVQQEPPALALKGFDPVALCEGAELEGSPGITCDRGRHRYRFVSEESLATFQEEPTRWGIQWGGACGRMGPLSGRGSADRWAVVDGSIYIFASDGCREGFLSDTRLFLPEVAERRAGDAEAGSAWIEKAVAAHGGASAIDGSKAVRLTSSETSSDWKQERELLFAADGSQRRRSVWIPPTEDEAGFDTVWVLTSEGVFTVEDGTIFDMSSAGERTDVRRYAQREVLPLLWARKRPDFQAVLVGANEIDVTCADQTTTLHLGEDGTILGLSWTGRLNDGVTREVKETFTEWATIAGVRVPTRRTVTQGGKETTEGPWTVELLAEPPPGAFQRP